MNLIINETLLYRSVISTLLTNSGCAYPCCRDGTYCMPLSPAKASLPFIEALVIYESGTEVAAFSGTPSIIV